VLVRAKAAVAGSCAARHGCAARAKAGSCAARHGTSAQRGGRRRTPARRVAGAIAADVSCK
jgi:hypothetical protein